MGKCPGGGRKTILTVDDEPSALKLIGMMLRGQYSLRTAQSVAEALLLIEENPIDLLILDIRLGGEDGLDVLAEFRRRSSAPVLIVTGFGSEEVAVRALELRASGYLRKPFTPEELRTRVASLVAEGPRPAHVAERAREVIEGLANQPAAAGDIARMLGVTQRQLNAAFLERFGRTAMQHLREVRMRIARELLAGTRLPIAEIASRAGFRDVTYFDRFFKQAHDMTPAEYRRTHVPDAPPSV